MLAGCPSTKQDVENLGPDELWDLLCEHDDKENVLSCSVPGEDKWSQSQGQPVGGPGLVSGHAYTLLSAHKLSTGARLLRLRNPWGRFEWNGDWGDTSKLWTPALMKEVNMTAADDGSFWMSLEDFRKYFTKFNICRINSAPHQRWLEYRSASFFNYTGTDGGVTIPWLYELKVESNNKAWIGLHQEDERCLSAPPYIDLTIVVLRVNDDGTYTLHSTSTSGADRQQQLYAKNLTPGSYLIVPFTSGIRTAASHTKASPAQLKSGNRLTAASREAVRKIFELFDQDLDSSFGRSDFALWYRQSHGEELPGEVYATIMGRCRDGFQLQDLVSYYEALDERTLSEHFRRLGFSDTLVLDGLRRFVVTVHAFHAVRLCPQAFDAKAASAAISQWLQKTGTPSEYCEGKLTVYEVDRSSAGVTLGVSSRFPTPLNVTMDCCDSDNVQSHRGALKATVTVQPGACVVVHHLAPVDPESRWSWTFSLSAKSAPR